MKRIKLCGIDKDNTLNLDESLSSILKVLAERISNSSPPNWPLPIFEAESYLYKYYIKKLFIILETLHESGYSWEDISRHFFYPSRIAELCYLFIGIRFSDLSIIERRKLVDFIIKILSCFRPDDPLCLKGTNIIRKYSDADKRKIYQATTTHDHSTLFKLNATLFSICEFAHVGIPQFGREVHGPYFIDSDRFLLIRTYYDFHANHIWPPLDTFPFKEIEISEVYTARSDTIRFDLMNHMFSDNNLRDHLESASVFVHSQTETHMIHDLSGLLDQILDAIDKNLIFVKTFNRSDWLVKHLEIRYAYLRPLLRQLSWKETPSKEEFEHLLDPPRYYEEIRMILHSPSEAIFEQLYSNFF